MNKVILTGNATSDIELKATPNGTSFCRFVIAVRRDKDTTDFIECEAWRVTAEIISKYVSKGDKVTVCGSLNVYEYEDKTGAKRRVVFVNVNEVDFMQKREEKTYPPKEEPKPKPQVDSDEELPF